MLRDADRLTDTVSRAFETVADSLLERVAAAEARLAALEVAPPPRDGRDGLPGRDGTPGAKGVDGLPGADGLGFDDLTVEYDGERTLALTLIRGDRRKSFPVTLPIPIYRGPYHAGQSAERGDMVSQGGVWSCNEPTITKPGESKAWTLAMRPK